MKHRITTLTLTCLLAGAGHLSATPIPKNLGGGLRTLVENESTPAAAARSARPGPGRNNPLKITDPQGRVLVDIMLDGTVPLQTVQKSIEALGGSNIKASSATYRAGVLEGFVSVKRAAEIAKMPGVSAVHMVPKPVNHVGAATTQGVVQHRIDKVPPNVNGGGITVGVLSDSYDVAPAITYADDDIASGDLPGSGNPLGNTKPVVVLEEFPFGADEGRAMLQIVHDIAPKARLGFATAFYGEVGFADNIRSLAGLPSGSLSTPNFKADIVVDDVGYLDEPMFQDGIIAQAVDDVAAAGVSYFSSAGNTPASQAYSSPVRLVPNTAAATAGTNLNFDGVDPALYKGGFQNFAQNGGEQDIAQDIHVEEFGVVSFQWNEPYDSTPPILGKILQSGSGLLTDAAPTKSFNFAGTAGQQIAIISDAAPGENPLLDSTITLIDPQGNELAFQDAGLNPEVLISFLPVTGTYKILIGGFAGATGRFIYKVREAKGTQRVVSDFNLLYFDTDGNYLGAVAENNRATNRPSEVAALNGPADYQMVIALANKPAKGAPAADQLRYVCFGDAQPMEYVSYQAPSTFGHNCAAGASGVGAYAFYAPFVPESFSSGGPVMIYFSEDNRRLGRPERRLKPDMAAMDGGNTTFFTEDVAEDPDDLPNFFGTSAAAPHAAGIAALMLQSAGGPRSLAPGSLRRKMQMTAFLHDLDPNRADAAVANGLNSVVLSAQGDGNNISASEPNFFTTTYFGNSSVTLLKLDLTGANPTVRPHPGLVFDTRPGAGFPFTLGTFGGVPAAAVQKSFSAPAPAPAVAGQFQRLTVSIKPDALTSGDLLRFGVDRDEADAFGPAGAVAGNSADLLGAGVLIPQGTLAPGGATLNVTLANGKVLQGKFTNRIGKGFSGLEGFGFVNAEAAVKAASQP